MQLARIHKVVSITNLYNACIMENVERYQCINQQVSYIIFIFTGCTGLRQYHVSRLCNFVQTRTHRRSIVFIYKGLTIYTCFFFVGSMYGKLPFYYLVLCLNVLVSYDVFGILGAILSYLKHIKLFQYCWSSFINGLHRCVHTKEVVVIVVGRGSSNESFSPYII